jgi:uncharacterized RDD family membrane protein YckC
MSGAAFEIVCNGCRSTVPSDAPACPACGVPLWGPRRASAAPAAVVRSAPALDPALPAFAAASGDLTASGYAVAAARQAIAPNAYGGFWIRAVAFVVDAILTGIVLAAVFFMAGPRPALLTSIAVVLLYHPLMESSGSRGTLGKTFCGLTVSDLSGRRISFGRAFVRNLARILDVLTLGIGYMMAGWTRRKQALHDFVAQTLVLGQ